MRLSNRNNRRLFWNLLLVAFFAALALPGPVRGGLLSDDTNAMTGWRASVPFSDFYYPAHTLNGSLDYAVYAPGSSFNNSFGAGADPSGGANYVYAYQIDSTASTDSINLISVGLDGDEMPAYPGFVSISSGVQPNMPGSLNPSQLIGSGTPPIYTSALWRFVQTKIGPGQSSKILIFTSPFGPEMDSVSIQGANQSAWSGYVASPVPEPATLLSLAVFGGIITVLHLLRRR